MDDIKLSLDAILLHQFVETVQRPYQAGKEFSVEAKLKSLFDLASTFHDISGTVVDGNILSFKVRSAETYNFDLPKAGSLMRTLLARMAFMIDELNYPDQTSELKQIAEKMGSTDAVSIEKSREDELNEHTAAALAIASKSRELEKNGFIALSPYGFEAAFNHHMSSEAVTLHVLTSNRNGAPLSFAIVRIR